MFMVFTPIYPQPCPISLLTQCWYFGQIFRKWSEILTFPPNWSELGILFHEKLEKLTFHMKLASIFALKLQGTNPPKGCIATSLATDLS